MNKVRFSLAALIVFFAGCAGNGVVGGNSDVQMIEILKLPAKQFFVGIPFLLGGACTKGTVRSKQWQAPMELTAAHCIFGSSGPEMQVNEDLDFALMPAGDVLQDVQIHPLAETLPQRGEKITVWGYPVIPLLGIPTGLKRIECEYLGPGMNRAPAGKKGLTVFQYARCPKTRLLTGMSGGPILNQKGEAIGALSTQVLSKTIYDEMFTFITFSEITETSVVKPAEGRYVEPLRDGTYTVKGVNVFVATNGFLSPEPMEKEQCLYELKRGNYEFTVKNNLIEGTLTAFRNSGVRMDSSEFRDGKPAQPTKVTCIN